MYIMKEKNRYSECYKRVLYAAPKSARNILTNLSPNPTRTARPDLQLCVTLKNVFHSQLDHKGQIGASVNGDHEFDFLI